MKVWRRYIIEIFMRFNKFALILIFFVLIQPAFSEPIVTSRVKYYSISGDDAAELRAQMHNKGPIEDGKRYDAFTRYYVNWRYDYQQEDNDCRLKNIRVTVDINYQYPKWVNYESGSERMRLAWDDYITKLKAHERGHGTNGQNAANEIDMMLARMSAMANCKMLGAEANQKAYAILAKYQHADIEYDRETKHGITQGVVLAD